jgi:hypothetical protein
MEDNQQCLEWLNLLHSEKCIVIVCKIRNGQQGNKMYFKGLEEEIMLHGVLENLWLSLVE